MVDARLEVLIVARDQLRRVLRGAQVGVNKLREGVQTLNRARTNRIRQAFVGLRSAVSAVGERLRALRARIAAINAARTTRINAQLRATGVAARGAAGGVRALTSALAPFIAVAALVQGVVSAIRVFAGFEQQMAGVRAITGATDEEFKLLNDTAKELGATTRFTAQQAAEGLEFLARAGFSAEEAAESLEATLNLASAGMLGLGESADIVSNVVQQFGVGAERASEVVDILATTAASSNTNVRQLGDALSFVGPVAKALDISVRDTAEALGQLGNAGIQAGTAGAGLRRALGALISPSREAGKQLADLGFTTERINTILAQEGGIITIFTELKDAGLDAALAFDIFQQRGATVALSLGAVDRASTEVFKSLENFNGAAKEISDTIEDTLLGDFRQLISAIQDVLIQIGEGGLGGGLRDIVRSLTEFVRSLGGATDSADGVGASLRKLFVGLGTIIGAFKDLIASDIVSVVFAPLGKALELLGDIAQVVTDSIDAIRDRLRRLRGEAGDTSLEVAGAASVIERRFKETTEANLKALDNFITGAKARRQRLVKAISDATIEASNASLESERLAAGTRLATLRESLDVLNGTIKAGLERGTEISKALIEERATADAEAQQQDVDRAEATNTKKIEALEALAAAAQKTAKAESAAFKQELTELEAIDKLRASQGLSRLEGFLEERQRLIVAGINAEIRAQEQAIASARTAEPLRIAAESDPIEQARIRAETEAVVANAETRIAALISERRVAGINEARSAAEAQATLARTVLEAERTVAGTGALEAFDTIRARIEAGFSDTLRKLEADSEQAQIIQKAIDVTAAEEQLSQVEAAFSASNQRLAFQQDQLKIQREAGQIDRIDFETRLQEAQRITADEQARLFEELSPLIAEGILTEEQILRVQRLQAGFEGLRATVLPIVNDIKNILADAFTTFFTDIVDGTKSAKEAFRDLAADVVKQLQKIIIQELVLRAIRGAFGSFGGGGGTPVISTAEGGLILFKMGGLIPKYAGGGEVKGRGTGTSDSIPARLSRGEYVVPAVATRQFLPFLEAMRQGKFSQVLAGQGITLGPVRMPRVPRFQGGGLVEPPQLTSTSGEQRGIRIVNAIDPSIVSDFLNSSEGEQVILNVLQRRPETVQRIIR